jgi:hypothetical protein
VNQTWAKLEEDKMLSRYKQFTRKRVFWVCTLVVFMLLFMEAKSWGETATIQEARQVSQNWLRYMVFQRGDWAGEAMPQLMEGKEIMEQGTLLGYYFPVSPSGFIAVPVLKELPPIKAYSEKYQFDINERVGFPALLKEVLLDRIGLYEKVYGSLHAVQPTVGDVLLGRGHRVEWNRLLKSQKEFQTDLEQGKFPPLAQVGPLLNTSWFQRDPYNRLCPMGDVDCDTCSNGNSPTYPSLVGCVGTAAAQILKYWNWPPYGKWSKSYWWDGDDSCDSTSTAGACTLRVTFSDSYAWENMPDSCDLGCTPEDSVALAELCYEVGVAFGTDYGVCRSGAYMERADYVFPRYFRYDSSSISIEYREYYDSAEEWFSIIQTEINNGRPMQYSVAGSTSGHSIVCDGWKVADEQNYYHMNYGWGGRLTAWFAIDSLSCPWEEGDDTLCIAMEELLVRGIRPAYKTLICGVTYDGNGGPLTPDGSPYLATCDVVVPVAQTLTIQNGVEIYFESGCKIIANGILQASGELGNPTKLLSEHDLHRGMKLLSDYRLQNGGEFKPGP